MMQPRHLTLLDWLKLEEGFRSEPYLCPTGHKTIGYGHNLEVHPINTIYITKEDAEWLLRDDVNRLYSALGKKLLWLNELSEERLDALLNMGFQMGVSGLLKFKRVLKALKEERWEDAAKCALDSLWAKQTPARAQRVAKVLKTGVMVTEDDFK